MTSRRAFITGAAGGFGRALAERFARGGFDVLLGDLDDAAGERAVDEIGAVAPGSRLHYLHCDVTSEVDVQHAADWLRDNWGGVDLLLNNAGVAISGPIDECSEADWDWIVQINLLGVARGCRIFAPMMKQQGGGYIVNIASLAGLIHAPTMSAYNATKSAVVAISETLAVELKPFGIDVSVVCPSFFRTGIAAAARPSNPEMDRVTRKLVEKSSHSADEIAAIVFDEVMKKRFRIQTHAEGKVAYTLKRLLPFEVYRSIIYKRASKMTR